MLTGKTRHRRGMFGGLILQVEIVTQTHPVGTPKKTKFRDVKVEDLEDGLLSKIKDTGKRYRTSSFGKFILQVSYWSLCGHPFPHRKYYWRDAMLEDLTAN